MSCEHEIVAQVCAAKEDNCAADRLVSQYMPFIKSETARFIRRIPLEGQDDELSIAMFAFHEAVLAYNKAKGAFLPFAARAIRNRLIDFSRKEKKHAETLPLDHGEDQEKSLIDTLAAEDEMPSRIERTAAREEITEFSSELSAYGLSLSDVADNCPEQARTLAACQKALMHAIENPELLEALIKTKKLPLSALAQGSGVEKKTLERHRKYLVAVLLAYTNGFEIIREHLNQVYTVKGGRQQ